MRKILLLSSLNVLLFACANQTNEEEVTSDSATYSSVAQETSSEEEQASYQSMVQNFTAITAEEIINKINNGDAFYLFVGAEDSADAQTFATKLEEASSIFENPSSADIEGVIYYLDLTNASDQATTTFTEDYGIDTVPAFHFFEGQIYNSEIEDINSENITVEEIQDYINTPYQDEHITTVPDENVDN
ncbi:thioredoxin [Aerococcus viridans]|uniref:thioredoxin n=1 Tax=Aerococcus TaxID=1375 RepID=UPI003AA84685